MATTGKPYDFDENLQPQLDIIEMESATTKREDPSSTITLQNLILFFCHHLAVDEEKNTVALSTHLESVVWILILRLR